VLAETTPLAFAAIATSQTVSGFDVAWVPDVWLASGALAAGVAGGTHILSRISRWMLRGAGVKNIDRIGEGIAGQSLLRMLQVPAYLYLLQWINSLL
jgi:hypothetical protein